MCAGPSASASSDWHRNAPQRERDPTTRAERERSDRCGCGELGLTVTALVEGPADTAAQLTGLRNSQEGTQTIRDRLGVASASAVAVLPPPQPVEAAARSWPRWTPRPGEPPRLVLRRSVLLLLAWPPDAL